MFALEPLQTGQANFDWSEVAVLRDGNHMAAALFAEAATAVATVMYFFHGEGAAKLGLTLVVLAIEGEVDRDPNRGSTGLVLRD